MGIARVSVLDGAVAAQVALLAAVFLIGAAVGSFLNVVVFRSPRGESLVYPRSRCLSCGEQLSVPDLVPVLSYLALRGKCRHCKRSYSPRYMLVELAMGLAALASWLILGPTLHAAVAFIATCCLTVIFLVDLDHFIIPDEAVAIIAGAGVVLDIAALLQGGSAAAVAFDERITSTLGYQVFLPKSLVGAAVGAGLFVAIAYLSERVFKRPGMGWGDVKLAGAMGTLLGPGYQFLAYFLLAVLIGAGVGLITILAGQRTRRDYIPFGPMMSVAGVLMLYFGETITPAIISRFLPI